MSAQITALAWREELDRVTALPTAEKRLGGVACFLTAVDEVLTPPDPTAAELAVLADLEARASKVFEDNARTVTEHPRLSEEALAAHWSSLQKLPTFREQTVAGGEDAELERKIAKRERELHVEQEARRRLSGRNHVGTRVIPWDEMVNDTAEWLVDGLIGRDGAHWIVARPNSGKTMAWLHVVLCMVYGLRAFGRETQQVPVLVVLGEGRRGFVGRIDAWCAAHKVDRAEVPKWLTFVDGTNLNSDTDLDKLRAVYSDTEAALVVLDTWATVSGQEEENSASMSAETLRRVREACPDAALWFIAHPTKDSEAGESPILRGSGALAGAADVVMTLWRDRGYSSRDGEMREWLALSTDPEHGGKNRNAPTETLRGLYLAEVGSGALLRQNTSEAIPREAAEVRRRWVGTMTTAEYAEATGHSKATAHRHVKAAVEAGVLSLTEGATGGSDRASRYRLRETLLEGATARNHADLGDS